MSKFGADGTFPMVDPRKQVEGSLVSQRAMEDRLTQKVLSALRLFLGLSRVIRLYRFRSCCTPRRGFAVEPVPYRDGRNYAAHTLRQRGMGRSRKHGQARRDMVGANRLATGDIIVGGA